MKPWLYVVMLIVALGGLCSFIWFLFGVTAHFQREIDIIGSAYLWFVGIPTLTLALLFIYLMLKKWIPKNRVEYILIYTFLILLIIVSLILFRSVSTQEWTNQTIEKDTLKVTSDNKYEYQIELINLFRKDSHAQLYLRNLKSGQEDHIKVEIKANEIVGLGISKVNNWVYLIPTDSSSKYLLKTTEDLGIPEELFIINTLEGNSKRNY